MDKTLTTKLIERGLINSETEVTARYKGIGVSGDLSVKGTEVFAVSKLLGEQQDLILFEVTSIRDGAKRNVSHRDIIEIDGMDPHRFAAVYDIKADGQNAVVGKRRGRKPKVRPTA